MSKNEHIFKEYYKRLCLYAYKLVDDMFLAEDIVQDAFCSFLDKSGDISDDEKAIRQYLYSSVRFLTYNHYRKNKTKQAYWEKTMYVEAESPSFEREIIYAEVMNEVVKIVETMPEACANIFRKGYLEELSNKEIAEELGVSVNTVKTQKRRGMKILLNKIHPEYMSLFLLFLQK